MTPPDPSSRDDVNVALLWHFRIGPEEEWDEDGTERLVGIYATEALAGAAAHRLRGAPGFREWPGGFRIFGTWLNHDSWTEGFGGLDDELEGDMLREVGRRTAGEGIARLTSGQMLFRLVHRTGGDVPDEKAIGTYTDRMLADQAVARLRGKPGFRDWPDGFAVMEYRLDDTRG